MPLQFSTIDALVTLEYPAEAAKLSETDDLPAQRALIGTLANLVYSRPAKREVELWRVDDRQVRCVAVYLPSGIDLRLVVNGAITRTELLRDGAAVEAKAEEWRSGWT